MTRITIKDLREEVKYQNEVLADSGSNVLFYVKQRNGYVAVDLHFIDETGDNVCHDYVECGSSRKCYNRVGVVTTANLGQCYHGGGISRQMAKARLLDYIDFDKDPALLTPNKLNLLHTWAKLTKYQKPPNCSRGYGFFLHLKNKVNI